MVVPPYSSFHLKQLSFFFFFFFFFEDFDYRFRVPKGKLLIWRVTCGENMQIICTQSGRKPFFGTWRSLTEGPNPSLLWSLFISLLSTRESLVLPSLNNSTRKSTGKSTLGELCLS